MKLIVAIVSNDDATAVSTSLNNENFQVTKLSTTGGFLRAGNTTLLIGTEDEKVDHALEIIASESKKRTEIVPSASSYGVNHFASLPIEVQVGGATIFILDIEKFIKI